MRERDSQIEKSLMNTFHKSVCFIVFTIVLIIYLAFYLLTIWAIRLIFVRSPKSSVAVTAIFDFTRTLLVKEHFL